MWLIRMIVKKNRKGISTFIATLLLMVLAVSAGVVIYAYTMGYLGGFGGPQTMGAISIDTWALEPTATGTNPELSAYIRNIGKTSFTPDAVYVNGQKLVGDWKFGKVPSIKPFTALAENEVGTLQIFTAQWNFEGSITYDVKIVGVDNTQLSFQVKK